MYDACKTNDAEWWISHTQLEKKNELMDCIESPTLVHENGFLKKDRK